MSNIHTGHRKRLKKRFLNNGIVEFEPHQILELLLFYGIPRKDTNVISHNLIKKFGSLSNVFDAEYEELMDVSGISENTATLIKLIPEITGLYQKDKWGEKPKLDSSEKAGRFSISLFVDKPYECFYLIGLDSGKRLIKTVLLNEGTIDSATVYPRNIAEEVILGKASSVILAHNHPGGRLSPSGQDIHTTHIIKESLKTFEVEVDDHIIAADNHYYSFAENGIL
jgi:DNA repair protein RadC